MLSPRGDGWQGLVIPQDLRDIGALRAALAGLDDPGILWVDVKAETQGVVTLATRQALLGAGWAASRCCCCWRWGCGAAGAACRRRSGPRRRSPEPCW
ncbi:hypothetical protein ACFQU7_23310 [Pseudoroseomonas wenyumeiae]